MSQPSPSSLSPAPDTEPAVTATTVPMWLIVGMLVLFFLVAWYFDRHGGWFQPKVYTPYVSLENVEAYQPPPKGNVPWLPQGKLLFEQNCALCHSTDGSGKPGQAPPLAGSEWALAKGVNRMIHIPLVGLTGPIQVKGQEWNLNMAAMGAAYTDEQLADVLSYIRNSWGNQASAVTAAQVKQARAEIAGRTQPYTVDELMKLAE